jgi:hypothetical protein
MLERELLSGSNDLKEATLRAGRGIGLFDESFGIRTVLGTGGDSHAGIFIV